LIGLWEVLPQFLAPAFSAINVFCLALPASKQVTALFGGASPNTSASARSHHVLLKWSLGFADFAVLLQQPSNQWFWTLLMWVFCIMNINITLSVFLTTFGFLSPHLQ
jgi:hypothetical protein